ncbi:MAG: hypothetical protein ACRD20_00815 [Terriglobales bacterium]
MNMALKLLIVGLVLLTAAFGQELKRGATKQEPVLESSVSTEQLIATGSPQRRAPVVQPKALPRLNPSLGEIARRARAAHAVAPKAEVVVADDALPKK